MTKEQTLAIVQECGVTVVALGPEYENLDEPLLDRLRSAILDAADRADPPRLLVDLSHTKFFGSSFIEILVEAWKRIRERGGVFSLCGVDMYCADVLRVTRLDQVWPMYPTRDEAVQALSESV